MSQPLIGINPYKATSDTIHVLKAGDTVTGPLALSTTGTESFYNTADQVTNYERYRLYWSGNLFNLESQTGGTGVQRPFKITASASQIGFTLSTSSYGLELRRDNTAITGIVGIASTSLQAASATQYGLSIVPAINQSSTAGYTMLLVNPSHTAVGSGNKLLADFQLGSASKTVIDTSGNIGLLATASIPTHSLTIGSTSTTGIAHYNTSDQITNYERAVLKWTSNAYYLGFEFGGTGTARTVGLASGGVAGGALTRFFTVGPTPAFYKVNFGATGLVGTMFDYTGSIMQAASGIQVAMSINPAINQNTTAGYTIFQVNPSITATGSGVALLADFQLGNSSKVTIDTVGQVKLTSVQTAFIAKTTTYTATTLDSTITGDATSATFTITLPTAVGIAGRIYTLKKIDVSANAVTVGTTSAQTIDGSTTYTLATQYKYVRVQSDGANWIVIGNN